MIMNRTWKFVVLFYLRLLWLAGIFVLGSWATGTVWAEEIVDRIVAVVNNEVITYLELQQEMRPYQEQIKSRGYDEDEEREMLFKLREEMIYRLIDDKLADQEIKKNRITVSDAEVDASIERLKAARMWSDEELRMALESDGMTLEELRQTMKSQALRNRLVGQEVSSKIVITQEEVRAYYDRQAAAYQGDLQYHLRNIIIKIASAEEGGRAASRTRMEIILQKLADGESFESLAQQYSESYLAKEGGDLGKIRYDDFSPQIKTALEGLGPGDHTGILDTDQGFQIFFVEDIAMEGGRSFEEASPEIEEKLYNDAVDKKYAEWLEELKSQAHIKIIR